MTINECLIGVLTAVSRKIMEEIKDQKYCHSVQKIVPQVLKRLLHLVLSGFSIYNGIIYCYSIFALQVDKL